VADIPKHTRQFAHAAAALAGILLAFAPAALPAETGIIQIPVPGSDQFQPATIVTPSGYEDPANADKRYGILILLHVAGGNHGDWPFLMDLPGLADKHARIIVCPTAGPYSWYADCEATGNASERFLIEGVIPFIDRAYRTRAAENDRWITGLSMGGYGGLRLGLRHPGLFSAFGGASACITPSQWWNHWNLNEALGPARLRMPFDLFQQPDIEALKRGEHPPMSLICGCQDFFYVENLRAHEQLKRAGVEHHWLAPEGGHDPTFWTRYLPVQLEFFEQVVPR
jgi:S-formylglutathione hydrolase FrmB